MKRPDIPKRAIDDHTVEQETGRSRRDWFEFIQRNKPDGRAALGKLIAGEKISAWWVATLTVEYEAHAGITEKDGRPKGYSLCSTKTVTVTPARAFTAFTTKADLDAWLGSRVTFDAVEGGTYATADGLRGTVRKLRPGKALVLTWDAPGFAAGSQVEVLFQPKGGNCGIVVNHTRIATRDDADAARAAWEEALTRLKSVLDAAS